MHGESLRICLWFFLSKKQFNDHRCCGYQYDPDHDPYQRWLPGETFSSLVDHKPALSLRCALSSAGIVRIPAPTKNYANFLTMEDAIVRSYCFRKSRVSSPVNAAIVR